MSIEDRVKKIVSDQLGTSLDEIQSDSSFVDDLGADSLDTVEPVSYTHLRAHETRSNLVCRLLLEKKK